MFLALPKNGTLFC